MPTGEYLGFRLSDLGLHAVRKTSSSAPRSPRFPALRSSASSGSTSAASSVANIRGGLISQPQPGRYGLFLVNNHGGSDSDLNEVGLMSTGDDLRLTLRADRRPLLASSSRTSRRGSSNTLTIDHPAFLDKEPDLFAGLFGANTQSDVSQDPHDQGSQDHRLDHPAQHVGLEPLSPSALRRPWIAPPGSRWRHALETCITGLRS